MDLDMAIARKNLDWNAQRAAAIDKCTLEDIDNGEPCTMCGKYCSVKVFKEYFNECK